MRTPTASPKPARPKKKPTPATTLDQLSLKHRLFVLGFLQHKGDKTKAARSAGYSPKTCVEQGYQLFRKLQGYIKPLTQELVEAHALSAEQVVKGLSLLASSDIGDYLRWDGNKVTLTAFDTLTPAQRYCIESVEQKTSQWGDTIKVTLTKKQPALDTLSLYHNLLKRPVKSGGLWVSFEDGTPVETANKRVGIAHTQKPVEVVFEDADPAPTLAKRGQ